MQHIHLISFDVPFPANYGGVIDVYYKIRALYELGVKVHLHCFQYNRSVADDLNLFCEEVHYYRRKPFLNSLPLKYPHIVQSRRSNQLLKRLLRDDMPILFEGLHSCYYLSHPDFEERKLLVRMHNIEWEYYQQLAERESRYWQRQYLQAESRQLAHFENILLYADHILCISPKDTAYYQAKFPQASYLPAFHGHSQVSSKLGQGTYCLYHGKLSVAENHEAAIFLIREVFAHLSVPLVIAGMDPLPELISEINACPNITLRHNPGDGEMLDLMHGAHIHVLPTFQTSGIKLKLINSLFTGRYVMVNPQMVHQTGLEFSTLMVNTPEEFRAAIEGLMGTPFTEIELAQRRANLKDSFSTVKNAQHLLSMMSNPYQASPNS